jgi:hypothetical protein
MPPPQGEKDMNPTQQTLELLKVIDGMGGLGRLDAGELAKAGINIATGLVAYDLEPVAQRMYPKITPLRNSIPRVGGGVGTGVHYKQVTGITPTSLGVAEGHRGGVMDTTVVEKSAAWGTLGQENAVSFEADESSLPGTDNRALAALTLLDALMVGEEAVLLGGNASLALGTTPTPTLADVATGGALVFNTTYKVFCVALTLEAYLAATIAGGVPAAVTRTNADGVTDAYGGGSAQKSAIATVTTANDAVSTHSLRASVTPVKGAVAYAWYWGLAGSELLGAITTINSVLITAVAAGTQNISALPSSDNSRNLLLFDGLLTHICTNASGAYYLQMPTGTPGTGTPLTSDGVGGIVEINTALKSFWDNYRLSPDVMYVNAQELNNITTKVLAGGAASLFQFNMNAQAGQVAGVTLTAGSVVGFYLNKFTMGGGQLVKIMLHPNVPPGLIVFRCEQIPYALPNVQNIIQVKTIRDYYQIDWPLRTRQYELGVYYRGVLMNRFAPAFGAIFNIANG